MSKERLLKILHEFHEDNNWLCYEYDKELNRFSLYENSRKVAEFILDNYALLMPNGTHASIHVKKTIRVAIAKYIVQEEELRNKKFYLRMKNPALSEFSRFLNVERDYHECSIEDGIEDEWYQTKFTESDIDRFKEEIDGFSELLELFVKEYVEDK